MTATTLPQVNLGRSPRVMSLFYNNPDNYPPIINGTRLLVGTGFTVDIICRDDGEHWGIEYPCGANVYRVGRRAVGWKGYAAFIAAALRRGSSATLFAAHDMHALLPATLLARRYRRPLVYHVHDYVDMRPALPVSSRLLRGFQRRVSKTAAVITVPDAGLAELMTRELGLARKPLIVANAPLARYAPDQGQLSAALTSAGYAFDKIVLRQGRIGIGHAIEATLESMRLWSNPRWGFVLIGIGDREYIARTRATAKSLGISERVAILPPVAYDAIGSFTVGADLGHAIYEPININHQNISGSNKIREYMAAGIPLVVADKPPLRALMARYGCGLVANERSPSSIAEAVNKILTNTTAAGEMGAAAARAFEQELAYKYQFAAVLRAYVDLTDRPLVDTAVLT